MIEVTLNAAAHIRRMLERRGQGEMGLRIGIRAGGCSGFEYTFAWEPAARDTDTVFEGANGAKVFVDPRSLRLLDGTVLDYDTSLLSRGFTFSNPHAKSTCGCGVSFSVADEPATSSQSTGPGEQSTKG
jgi:iron-sulfur cluster assembly accessory protein